MTKRIGGALGSLVGSTGKLAGAIAAATIAFATNAHGSWPMSRHDARRTGATDGSGNLTQPVKAWKYFLGGSLYDGGAIAKDLDGDGTPELIFINGGTVIAKRADDTLMWQSPPLSITSLAGIADLDGDGKPELMAYTDRQAIVIDALSGAVDWIQTLGEVGFVSAVLSGDIDGDGLPDLLVQDCGCCSLQGSVPGTVYSFAGNVTSPKQLFHLPYFACGGGLSTTLLDLDGNGLTGVLVGRDDGFDLINGVNGLVQASVTWGTASQFSQCIPADVVAGPGEEAVCLYNNPNTPGKGRQLILLLGSGGSLTVMWEASVGAIDGVVSFGAGTVVDLDGDGKKEIVVSGQNAAKQQSTYVFDGTTGAQLTVINGHKLSGVLHIDAAGPRIMTSDDGTIAAWKFDHTKSPAAVAIWQIADQRMLTRRDFDLKARCSTALGLVAQDLTGDGVADLPVAGGDGNPGVQLLDTSSGTPKHVATFPPPGDAGLIWAEQTTVQGKPALVTGFTDGLLRLHDSALQVLNPPGVRFGGYVPTAYSRQLQRVPVTGSLGGNADALLVQNASGALLRLDATLATPDSPPVAVWSRPHAGSPQILGGLDADQPGIVCVERQPVALDPHHQQITALHADGTAIWSSPLDGIVASDPVSGHLDGDGPPDIIVQWAGDDLDLQTRAISGASGKTLWNAKPYGPGIGIPTGAAVTDWDGDGVDDLLFQYSATRVISGASGAEIGADLDEGNYGCMPIPFDVDGDGKDDAILHASFSTLRVIAHSLDSQLWNSTDNDLPGNYGAIAQCKGTPPVLVTTSQQNTARLKASLISGPEGGSFQTVVLAGGQLFGDEASATAAGMRIGVLGSVVVHSDLTGKGTSTAVVGSTDGWLYALDACTLALDFSVDFGSAVGAIIFGDTDGDGKDELLVAVADGYIYALKQPNVMAPDSVWDVDPEHEITDHDVDEIATKDTLWGKWAAVEGAKGYEVSIVREDQTEVLPWQDAGAATEISVSNLPLEVGARYLFGVRAITDLGASASTFSDGVKVIADDDPHTPKGGSYYDLLNGRACTCTAAGANGDDVAPLFWGAALVAAIGARRRRAVRDRRA